MATYPILSPTLAALDATKGDPLDNESASKLGEVLRQTRTWMFDYLSTVFDDTIGLKPSAIGASTIPPGSIRGSAGGITEREIAFKTISANEIGDGQITDRCIAQGSITNSKVANETLTGLNIKYGSLSGLHLVDGTVDASKITPGSVQKEHLAAASVTSAKIADSAVRLNHIKKRDLDGSVFVQAAAGTVMIGGQTVGEDSECLAPVKLSGALSIDAAGFVTISSGLGSAYARVFEGGGPGIGIAATTAETKRGLNVPWKVQGDKFNLVDIDGTKILIRQDGKYLFLIRAPAINVGKHYIKVNCYYDAFDLTKVHTRYGTSEKNGVGVTNSSEAVFFQSFSNNSDPSFCYIEILHAVETVPTVDGLGKPALATTDTEGGEVYADVTIIKLS